VTEQPEQTVEQTTVEEQVAVAGAPLATDQPPVADEAPGEPSVVFPQEGEDVDLGDLPDAKDDPAEAADGSVIDEDEDPGEAEPDDVPTAANEQSL
jgi:hypothetical protein